MQAVINVKDYPDYSPTALMESLGILPMWVAQAIETGVPVGDLARFVNEEMYQSGSAPMQGGTVDAKGVYNYPEDPPMPPILTINHPGISVYFYEHAMVTFQTPDSTVTYRMD